ncbi:MAG TPA: hypothetical protein VMU95_11440 [Trebonia sp.]|nr:hypothetical protein [Trebonia sp.]
MDESRATRLIATALQCYPARWQRRHGDEAAELATLLLRDGTPAASIALSYLAGAAREWLTPRPSRRLSALACALLVVACSLGVSVSVELAASAAPARAASTAARPRPHPRCPPPVPAIGHSPNIIREPVHGKDC